MRSLSCFILVIAACAAEPAELQTTAHELSGSRTHVAGDVYHYEFVIPVGTGPNAELHIHRVVREQSPWRPRRLDDAIVLMHGDFSTFATNFTPMSTWLAARNVDVWGIDRRWASAPPDVDLSDFDAMGLDQELDDIGKALAFVRGVRLVGGSTNRVSLLGFSRGGQLAYFYASREALRPPALRHLDGLVPFDVYATLAEEDAEIRQFYCDTAAYEYDQLANGNVDVPNDFQISIGAAALAAPADQSEWIPRFNNRQMMLWLVGKTFLIFPAQPVYHLNAPTFDANNDVDGLRLASETVVSQWLADAAPHQAMRESADTDGIMCGDTSFDVPLSRIRVPLLSIAAAGGYGARAAHSTTQVSSIDVTSVLIRQLPVEREREDYGHADLLFAPDAPQLAWQPLLTWLRAH